MSHPIKSPRKLIEVALPLDAINEACAREKSIRHGHPSTLHLWWARRPLAAARAVIFAQLVNDPGYQQGHGFKYGMNKKEAAIERKRLFKIIEELVKWENTTNEEVLERARAEIRRSWREVCELNKDHSQASELFNPDKMPGLHDPFAGGGAIPLEAQRLGLDAYASDLNPVAVLINKAMIEIPPKFEGRPPVSLNNSKGEKKTELPLEQNWSGARGLAEDIRYYGNWVKTEAHKKIGVYYPEVVITPELAKNRLDLKGLIGQKLTIIAWIWARSVKSPNPAFRHIDVPLAATFTLTSKSGREAYVKPVVNGESYRFDVVLGKPTAEYSSGTKAIGRGSNFRCLISGTPISGDYIKSEGTAGRLGQCLLAIVVDSPRGRVYLPASSEDEELAFRAKSNWKPSGNVPARLTGGTCVPYGLKEWADLFTDRQLLALTTFSELIATVKDQIIEDINSQYPSDRIGLEDNGVGPNAYADAICVYLAFSVSRLINRSATTLVWNRIGEKIEQVFARQAIPMTWDFPEANVFSDSTGGWSGSLEWIPKVLENLTSSGLGYVYQKDAQTQDISKNKIISTDPPYYDNIAYADLADFFYVWLRSALKGAFPKLLATIETPKKEELVAAQYRHGGKEQAETFFLHGMTKAIKNLTDLSHPEPPITIYYAFKQSETYVGAGTSSTGWETFLEAVSIAGLQLTGTWPLRTERDYGVKTGSNVLASSIVLVCRKRPADAVSISRREFIRELSSVLPEALDEMTKGSADDRSPVAPVDLSQAIIGPGMAVFSKYTAVLEADGSEMSIKTALQLINRFLAEDDFDSDTQFCLSWFEQNGWKEGAFGSADTLARGKGTSVDGIKEAGVIESGGGNVRLYKWAEYPSEWDPKTDKRTPVWEALHQLIRALKEGGESASGTLLAALGGKADAVRQLAYRLYTLCERLGMAEDARAYNDIITSWSGIETAASTAPKPSDELLPGFENQ